MRVVTTPEQTAKIAKLLGLTDVPAGALLTITSPKSQPGRACECGCGNTTSGGHWSPGHDAKHKSALFAAVRGDDASLADAAMSELVTRGWPLPTAKKAKEVTAPADASA